MIVKAMQLNLFKDLLSSKKSTNKKKSSCKKEILHRRGLEFEIRRKKYLRNLSLYVEKFGHLRVHSGIKTPAKEIFRFIDHNWNWIQSNIEKAEELKKRYPQKKYETGEQFLFRGRYLTLKVIQSIKKRPLVYVDGANLIVEIEASQRGIPEAQKNKIKGAIRKFYSKSGKDILIDRVSEISAIMDLLPKKITIRGQKTMWGSCNSKGTISLNWKLAAAPLHVIDYVVVHELSHLAHQNHSKRFWNLVATHCATYKECRRWLGDHQIELEFLNP